MPLLAPAPPPLAAALAPARMLVFADEFRFGAGRRAVPAGPLRLQVRNIGEDDHDLRILGPRGTARAATRTIRPGGLGEIRVRLAAGRYTFHCTVDGHAARGMRGALVVRGARRR